MKNIMLMTPGPTTIHESVRMAASLPITNPDLDPSYYEFHKKTCDDLKAIFHTQNDTLILDGEGILGLEASCASLIEPGDRVLCIDNGIFGNGFGDFAKMYGADVIYFKTDYEKSVSPELLESFLAEDHNFKLATLVHCETPSGITNPVDQICPILKKYGILSVVDSVSALGGEELFVDDWQMDVVIAGSQKCLSAAPGLTLMSISSDAWNMIESRKSPITGFYLNLTIWKNWYENKWFPYTQPISQIYQLEVALTRAINDSALISRHHQMAQATRESFIKAGFDLYAKDGFSNTVTTVCMPIGMTFKNLFDTLLEEHGILIGGGIGHLKDQVFRIGHMGENCYPDKIWLTLRALDQVFEKFNIKKSSSLHKNFTEEISSFN